MRTNRTRISAGNGRLREHGIALVLVLWATALLTVIAASFAFSMRTETLLSYNYYQRARAEAMAEAGLTHAILVLLNGAGQPGWSTDGALQEVSFDAGLIRLSVVSEDGKVDLNKSPREIMKNLLQTAGVDHPEQTMTAIEDWLDKDSSPPPQGGGAEDSDYVTAQLPYASHDGPIGTVEELNQVLGITEPVFERLRPYLTVHSRLGQIDVRSASPVVLAAIPGLEASVVKEFVDQRIAARDSVTDIPFSLLAPAGQYIYLAPEAKGPATGTYTVTIQATTEAGTKLYKSALIHLSPGEQPAYGILSWETATSQTVESIDWDTATAAMDETDLEQMQ